MLKAPPGLAQDLMENALPCRLWQSREAGSCMGVYRRAVCLRCDWFRDELISA